mgnify:CR=1 FL=1
MKPLVLTLLAAILGMALNGYLIAYSHLFVAPPVGADLTTEEGLLAAMPLMEPKHYAMPFLAHALGTLLSAFLVSWWVRPATLQRSMLLGFVFLAGGLYMVRILPSPMWFNILDLGLAYLPMAYMGYHAGRRV